MPFKVTSDEGEEKEVFERSEYEAALKQEREKTQAELAKSWEEKEASYKAELEKKNRVLAEKTENFKRLNEMTEEERSKLTAEQVESRKIAEAAEARAKAVEEKYEKEKQESTKKIRERTLKRYAGDNADKVKKLEEMYALINMPESDEESIDARALAAARATGLEVKQRNPLNQSWSGEAPKIGPDFANSERLKAAQDALAANGLTPLPEAPKK